MQRFIVGSLIAGFVLGGSFSLRIASSPSLMAASTGSITGRVVFVGTAPKPKKIKVTKDNNKCGSEKLAEDLIVSSDGGIKNAVVSLVGVKGDPTIANKNPTLDQKGCVFNPHVLIAPVGTPVKILNNDRILHNFHTYSSKNPAVNKAQPGFKKKMTQKFAKAETFKITCDAHAWMSGWIVVTDHPYVAATDSGGAFKLADVPAGTHKVEIWHETLGKVSKQISVKAGEETKVTFELSRK